ncbi:hypothetical protein Tco_1320261 [Tanacetum coccineum]
MAPLPPHEQRYPFLRYQGLEYTNADITDFKERLERIYSREIHRVQVVDFQRMPELIRDCFFARIVMEHHDEVGVVVFTSRAWGRLFDTRGPLLGGARRQLSWRQFILALGLHTEEEMESPGFARYWSESERMIPKGWMLDRSTSLTYYPDIRGGLLLGGRSKLISLVDSLSVADDEHGHWVAMGQRGSLMLRLVPLEWLKMLLLLMRVTRPIWHPCRHLSSHHHQLQLLLGLCPRD